MKKRKYIAMFLRLRCAGDVLNVVSPIQNITKEITESMAVIKYIKRITIKQPMKYTIYDLCAGNALTSVLSVFMLPVKNAVSIDKKDRKRKWHLADRFKYLVKSIYDIKIREIEKDSIIISVHPCTSLAKEVIRIYNESSAKYLIIVPCCVGKIKGLPEFITNKLGK